MILEEAVREFNRLNRLLEAGLEMLREAPERLAKAEAAYRKGKAKAWVERIEGTAKEREAQVDADTAGLRYERDIAEGLRRAAFESVRSRQTQISAWQSLLNAHKAEAQISAYAPEEGP